MSYLVNSLELLNASIKTVEVEYYSEVKKLTDNYVYYNFDSYKELTSSLYDNYSVVNGKLFGIFIHFLFTEFTVNFDFDAFKDKRDFFFKHNNSIAKNFFPVAD